MREEPPKPTIEFRNDRYLRIAVVRRLGFELRNPYEAVIGVFDRTPGLEEARDLVEWRPWALSGPAIRRGLGSRGAACVRAMC
jgi:hypothetical protein